jgi:hypothetical protein
MSAKTAESSGRHERERQPKTGFADDASDYVSSPSNRSTPVRHLDI